MQNQTNTKKKAAILVIFGLMLTAFGILLGKKPEAIDAIKAKIAERFPSK